MKKSVAIFLLTALLLFLFLPLSASAEYSDEILEQSGAQELAPAGDAETFLAENDISFTEPAGVLSLSPSSVLQSLWDALADDLSAPIRLLGIMVTVCVLAAMTAGIGDTVRDPALSKMLGLVCVLVCVLSISGSVGSCFSLAADTLETGGTFMLAYVPVFASVTAAGGGMVTAASYQMILLTAAELMVQIAAEVLLPLLQMSLAIAVVDAMNPSLNLTSLLTMLKKTVTWLLGLMLAVFGGLLSVQCVFGASSDTVATKATKFMLSSCVPVVGSAVSDAYNTIRGSVGVLRGGLGAVGIAALAFTVLPPILLLLAYRLSFCGAGIVAELLDVKPMQRLFRNLETIFSIAVGTVSCFSFLFLVATALMILLLGGS